MSKLRVGLALLALVLVGGGFSGVANAQTADVAVIKFAPEPVTAGGFFLYAVNVLNVGPDPATGVMLVDVLPAGISFVSVAAPPGGTCSEFAGTVTCALGTFAVGDFRTVFITVQQTAGTEPYVNTAAAILNELDPDPSNNGSTVVTTVAPEGPNLSLRKTDSPDPVLAGSTITYTLTVDNPALIDAIDVVLFDQLPTGTTLLGTSPSQGTCVYFPPNSVPPHLVQCDLGTIPSGSSATVQIQVAAPPTAGPIRNSALIQSVNSLLADPDYRDNVAFEDTTVLVRPTAVTFESFTATRSAKGVLLRWRTASEPDLLGFDVYREARRGKVRLNRSLIRAKGGSSGAAYSWLDRAGRGGQVRYWLRAVHVDGSRKWQGPITPAARS
jgi:uncharacterized repeat protein (TIGR01451 family)